LVVSVSRKTPVAVTTDNFWIAGHDDTSTGSTQTNQLPRTIAATQVEKHTDNYSSSKTTQTTTNNSESAESRYVVYTPELVDQYLEDNKKVILNFSATRCPVCQALKKDIMTKLDSIPLDTVIVEVDYDTYEDLKDEYGVTKQTTLIYINKDKSEIARTYRPSFDDVIWLVQ